MVTATHDVIAAFRSAIEAAGLTPPESIEADGRLHRFASNGKRGDDSGFYTLHGDGVPAGLFGCWRAGVSETWRADLGRKLSPVELAANRERVETMRRERDAERKRRQDAARETAEKRWAAARPADPDHAYLRRKRVRPRGIKQEGDALLVPMRADGELHSLQVIDAAGEKRFLPGARVAGCHFFIGAKDLTRDGTICIAEGYATGASVLEATGHAVAIAFSSGNLLAVARALREKMPQGTIVLCADDDAATPGNPGLTKAREAARAVGGLVAVPDFGADRPDGATDFNDLACIRGAEAVREAVARASAPEASEPQPATPSAVAAAPAGGDVAPVVELVSGASVKPEAIRWLWDGWLAAGKLHVLAGPPGTGKTTLALALAAAITNAGRWPDGTRAAAGDVVIWSGEDGIGDTLAPRLTANDADMRRVQFVRDVKSGGERRPFDPATDTPALELALARMAPRPVLLIVDPIVSAVAGDSHKNTETRRSLQPLVDLGERIGCAVLGISHFSKGTSGRDPVERVTGSIAFGALARVVLAAVKTTGADGKPGPRLFARAKSNNGPDGGGFNYSLDQIELPGSPGIFASRVLWGEAVEGEAKELLASAETDTNEEERTDTDDAKTWLTETLRAAGGSMEMREVMSAARRARFPERTIYRARRKANVSASVKGFGTDKRSVWVLETVSGSAVIPAPAPIPANAANHQRLAGMAEMEPVGRNGDASEPDTGSAKAPAVAAQDAQDAQRKRLGALDAFGDSRAPSRSTTGPIAPAENRGADGADGADGATDDESEVL